MNQVSDNQVLATAKVHGQDFPVPEDLYIPPDALQVFLEAFEGPLDLLLYLIKKQNMDILNIQIAKITHQYMQYVEMIQGLRFELAAEYLLMAAMLAEIKSRMLLPKREEVVEEDEDPRAELVRRLQEYEQFKKAAEKLDELPQEGRDVFTVQVEFPKNATVKAIAPIELKDLILAFKDVMARAVLYSDHKIAAENISIRGRMSDILSRLQSEERISFEHLFVVQEGRLGVVVTFLAILELLKQALVEIFQENLFDPIHIQRIL